MFAEQQQPLNALSIEKLVIVEALLARDHAIYRLESICSALREKETTITRLEQENSELDAKLTAYTSENNEKPSHVQEMERLYALNKELQSEIDALKQTRELEVDTDKENIPKVSDQCCASMVLRLTSGVGGARVSHRYSESRL